MPTAEEIAHLVEALTVQQYRRAFLAIEAHISRKQREILCAHYDSPGRTVTATWLAKLVAFDTYDAVNLQYGRLAHKLWDSLALPSRAVPTSAPRPGAWTYVLAKFGQQIT